LRAASWVGVVEDGVGAERFDEVEVVAATGGEDFVAGEFGELDS